MITHPYRFRSKQSLWLEIIALKKRLQKFEKVPTVVDVFDAATTAVQMHYPNFNMDTLRSRSRLREVVIPRQIWQYLVWTFTDTSITEVGIKSNRDHSSCLWAAKQVENLRFCDKNYDKKVAQMEEAYKLLLSTNNL